MPTPDCPTVELQLDREVFGKAFTVDIVVVVSRTQCRSISSVMVAFVTFVNLNNLSL